jgi:hypothetical protein
MSAGIGLQLVLRVIGSRATRNFSGHREPLKSEVCCLVLPKLAGMRRFARLRRVRAFLDGNALISIPEFH